MAKSMMGMLTEGMITSEPADLPGRTSVPTEYLEPRWYAAYTCANREKRVAEQLVGRGVEQFLPLYDSARRWKDRRVRLQCPLFPGYVFVRLALKDRLEVLQIPSVVRLVGFNGQPSPLPENEIASIRNFLAEGHRTEPHPYLHVGRRVCIVRGPLEGLEGILLKRKNNLRIVVSLDLLQRSMAVDVGMADVELLSPAKVR